MVVMVVARYRWRGGSARCAIPGYVPALGAGIHQGDDVFCHPCKENEPDDLKRNGQIIAREARPPQREPSCTEEWPDLWGFRAS